MKKGFFQGELALMSGIIGATMMCGIMFRLLHLVGGCLMLWVLTPLMLAVLFLSLSCYVFKYGALKQQVEKGVAGAKHLLNVEGTAFIALAIGAVAVVFRTQHWQGTAILIALSCFTLAILAILAGFFAFIMLKDK